MGARWSRWAGDGFQIFYLLPGNIVQEYRLLGVCFPWEPGGQKHINIAQNYQLLGIYFPWDPGWTADGKYGIANLNIL